MLDRKLIRNAAECVGCGKILESTHRHDFRTHECSKGRRSIWFMVDGGLEYVRRGWQDGAPGLHFIERSEYEYKNTNDIGTENR